jgi:hypothetical protein
MPVRSNLGRQVRGPPANSTESPAIASVQEFRQLVQLPEWGLFSLNPFRRGRILMGEEKKGAAAQHVKEENTTMEYIVPLILLVLAALFVVGTLVFWRRGERFTESSTGGRTTAVKACFNLCRDDPKQTFYSCATMCSYPSA